ncbi:MAG: glycosyltransferase family 4 protein [Spirulina sp.]
MNLKKLRVAWVFPSLKGGNYWHPILSEYANSVSEIFVFTGEWEGYSEGFENSFPVQVVGKTKVFASKDAEMYTYKFSLVSPKIILHLKKYRPHVIFTSGFSIWTLLVLLLKRIYQWKVVIVYDGSSPNIDFRNSTIRTWIRRQAGRSADSIITNSSAGKEYISEYLRINSEKVFHRPYQVPANNALLRNSNLAKKNGKLSNRMIFLFVGQLIPRKGLMYLLQACQQIKSLGRGHEFILQVVGQGPQEDELKAYCMQHGLPVEWIGWVDYGAIGTCFHNANVFVFPTLEDTWGMVVLEAMAFGKPVICSKGAGASELIQDGQNGFLVESKNFHEIVNVMLKFLECPNMVDQMGEASKLVISKHTPELAKQFLLDVTKIVVTTAER